MIADADEFYTKAKGKSAQDAFEAAREEAQWGHGHSGRTGTIAEKSSFVGVMVPEGKDPIEYARELMRAKDPRFSDKRGPAGCIHIDADVFLFFGFANS